MNREKFNTVFKSISEFFGILSNADRVKILGLLMHQELDVHDIQEKLNISQSRVSQHLKLLKLNNIVEERRDGKYVYYHVKDVKISTVIKSVLLFNLSKTQDKQTLDLFNELFILWNREEKNNE